MEACEHAYEHKSVVLIRNMQKYVKVKLHVSSNVYRIKILFLISKNGKAFYSLNYNYFRCWLIFFCSQSFFGFLFVFRYWNSYTQSFITLNAAKKFCSESDFNSVCLILTVSNVAIVDARDCICTVYSCCLENIVSVSFSLPMFLWCYQ